MTRIATATLLFALAASAAGGAGAVAPDCAGTFPQRLRSTGSATQLITVVSEHRTATQASLRLWTKVRGCWRPAAPARSAWVGQRGISMLGRKREGDRTTPSGSFGLGRIVYGVAPDPGVRFRYRRVSCGDWWVEDPRSPYYNRFRRTPCGSRPPFRITSGDLSESPTAYRHFAFIRYNADPVVPGRGSGIFLHASTGRPTLGCVSLPLSQLVATLRWLRPSAEPRIVIATRADLPRL